VDAAGHLQIDTVTSALPAGAATAANQVLALAQLGMIEDVRHALQSIATDRLIVRGEDQLFSFKGVLGITGEAVISGANGYIESIAVPAGEIWVVSTILARDNTSPTTRIILVNRHDGASITVNDEIRAFGALDWSVWGGHTYMDQGDVVRASFIGGQAGDTCRIDVSGYRMTVET